MNSRGKTLLPAIARRGARRKALLDFTFAPDDSKILTACCRSNNNFVVDPNSYRPLGTVEGFKLPWGIVNYPWTYGSLGLQ
jgi:hypothetical protein